jgi:peptidoglycan-associated lipoprotein
MKKLSVIGVSILSIALLSSGCKRKPVLTPIPPSQAPRGSENSGNGPGSGVAMTPEPPIQSQPANSSGLPASTGNFDGTQDRSKFAADTVYFDFDRATIKSSEESKLQEVANFLKSNTSDLLIIEGNCDERGTEKYNLALGDRRALAAREYLANLGVNPQSIKTVTYGASKPADPGHDKEAWAKNRRDEFVLVLPK